MEGIGEAISFMFHALLALAALGVVGGLALGYWLGGGDIVGVVRSPWFVGPVSTVAVIAVFRMAWRRLTR